MERVRAILAVIGALLIVWSLLRWRMEYLRLKHFRELAEKRKPW